MPHELIKEGDAMIQFYNSGHSVLFVLKDTFLIKTDLDRYKELTDS